MLGLEEAREALAMLGAQRLRHDQVGHVAADRLVRAPAERRLGRVVPVDDAPALVHRDHGVERGLEHRAEPRLAGAHLRLGVSPRDELPDLAAEHAHRLEHAVGSGSRASCEKNSITPTIPRGLRSGNPNAACRPARLAASARGKFRSDGLSTIHAGSPDSSTRPEAPRRPRA